MHERTGAVTFKGGPMTLVGPELKVGDKAPDCMLVGTDMKEVAISGFRGKPFVLSAVPSLDTPVCSLETRKFNESAGKLGPDVPIVTVSMDLPFAQKRWCAAEGVSNVVTLSDYRDAKLARSWGLLVKELHLLARCVFVIDGGGTIRYIQLVKEIASEPDYAAVLDAVAAARKG